MAKSVRCSQSELVRLARLTVIRGIGLEQARILSEVGIDDFQALAGMSKKRLAKLFPNVKGGELKQWRKQAKEIRLKSAGPVVEEKPQPGAAEPLAENEAASAPVATDDLAVIEGLGPARVRVLSESGIIDFRTLARASIIGLEKLFPEVAAADLLRWKQEARMGLARNRAAWLARDREV